MSQELPKKTNASEEVDLIVFFNLIGGAMAKVFAFLANIVKFVFSTIIYVIKQFIKNWKLIAATMLVAGVIGFFLEKAKPVVYSSEMLVRPHFDSKFQLITNVSYFNALIASKDHKALSAIFKIDTKAVKNIKGFTINPGPETENDKILQYESFISKLDSVRAQGITFTDYIDNRSIYSGNLFLITAEASQKNIFKTLEEGLSTSFTNQYSANIMQKRDSINAIKKENVLANLRNVDSLKRVYIAVLRDESQSSDKQLRLGDIDISVSQDKTSTREYELLDKEMALRNELRKLEEEKIQEDVFFDVVSSFQLVGNRVSKLTDKYTLIFPVLALFLLCFLFLTRRTIEFANNYED